MAKAILDNASSPNPLKTQTNTWCTVHVTNAGKWEIQWRTSAVEIESV